MTKVVVTNGNVDGALKKFKVKVARSGVPSELKKHKHYDKPRAFLFKEKKVCRHHKAGQNGSRAVYPCQACAFGSDDGAAGQAQ